MILPFLSIALIAAEQPKAPFQYVWTAAYHVLPGTHTDESGYFSLCEGHNGKIYVGTAAYGFNAYLVEFDPKTGKQRIVVDVNKVCGLVTPGKPTYAAQSKIHTRNFVAPSGKIYVGSKQGYRRGKDDTADYPGGYVVVYDPATDRSENLGMPFKGEGVNDVTADEKAGLVYVVTCEDHHWMVLDLKTKKYREPDPKLRLTPYAQTLIDHQGRAVVVTRDFKLARFDPAAGKLEYLEIASDGKPVGAADDKLGPACWALTADARTAYLVRMSDSRLFQIDLASDRPAVPVHDRGRMLEGKNFDSRGSLIVGHDAKVYALMRVDNETGFGKGYLHHLVSHDPATGKMRDHGVLGVKNPDWFDFSPGKDGKPKPWSHGFHKLPDGTWTPLHVHMALIQAKDRTLYATSIYPFTLLRIEAREYK
jgi:sugar lactone lactonase YvrE